MQSDLFDAVEADRLKEEGINRAVEWTAPSILEDAQKAARSVARDKGWVTIDDVQHALEFLGWQPDVLGNSAGSIFKGKSWEFTGEWRKSTRTTNHGRYVRVWRLKS